MNSRIVFSPSQRRPGCVLLQVALGGDVDSGTFHKFFPSETWLVSPTDDMGAYPIDEVHSLEALSKIAAKATPPRSRGRV
jgi:hypothetical protein